MRISVFGCGYLGAVHAACMAKLGHEVVGIDVVEAQVAALARGEAPFYEPGLPQLKPGDVVVGKSTVPVGTAELLAERIRDAVPEATLLWNPEFLREGHAVDDTLRPDRFVYGVEDGPAGERTVGRLDAVYADALAAGVPRLVTNLATAQLVKVAANSFLATKISFINAMAELCEVAGADVTMLAD